MKTGNRTHYSARGRAFSETTFNDQRTLMHIPQGFNIKKPGVIVVFFHGHGAEFNRDIRHRQKVPAQISQVIRQRRAARAAIRARCRRFQRRKFLAARRIRPLSQGSRAKISRNSTGDPKSEQTFARMPVMIVSYSGGFAPTAGFCKTAASASVCAAS